MLLDRLTTTLEVGVGVIVTVHVVVKEPNIVVLVQTRLPGNTPGAKPVPVNGTLALRPLLPVPLFVMFNAPDKAVGVAGENCTYMVASLYGATVIGKAVLTIEKAEPVTVALTVTGMDPDECTVTAIGAELVLTIWAGNATEVVVTARMRVAACKLSV